MAAPVKQGALFPELADVAPPRREPPVLVTEAEVVAELASRARKRWGEQQRVAQELGLSQAAVSNVLTNGRGIGPKIARALGYRKVIRFEKVE